MRGNEYSVRYCWWGGEWDRMGCVVGGGKGARYSR